MSNLRSRFQSFSGWHQRYAWGCRWFASLRVARILPKFMKARPIIACDHCWHSRLTVFLAKGVFQIMLVVFPLRLRWATALRVLAHTLEYARVRSSTLEYARVRTSMLEYARVRSSTLEYARVRTSTLEYARVRSSTLEYARVRTSTLEYARVRSSTHEYARVRSSTLEYARVRSSTLEHARVRALGGADALRRHNG